MSDYVDRIAARLKPSRNGHHEPPAQYERLAPARARLSVVTMNEVEAVEVQWLWPNWIARGKLHLAYGPPGVGKSYVTCADIVARITTGKPWPDGSPAGPVGEVLILAAEDGLDDTLRPRLDAAGADTTKVHVLRSVTVPTDDGGAVERQIDIAVDAPLVDELLAANPNIVAVIADPISEHLGSIDGNSNIEVRQKLMPAVELAARRKVAFIAVSHINKGGMGPALFRAAGSVAFSAVARVAWIFVRDTDDESRVLVLPTKNNLAPQPKGLAFRVHDNRVEWEHGHVELTADEACDTSRKGKPPELLNRAVAWLKEKLSRGCAESEGLEREAVNAGITKSTLWRARKELGVRATKIRGRGKGWWISLPEDPQSSLREIDSVVSVVEDDRGEGTQPKQLSHVPHGAGDEEVEPDPDEMFWEGRQA